MISEVIRFNSAEVPTKMGTFPQYAYPHAKARYAEVADFLGLGGKDDDAKVKNLIKAIEELKAKVGIRKTIKDYGVEEKTSWIVWMRCVNRHLMTSARERTLVIRSFRKSKRCILNVITVNKEGKKDGRNYSENE